MRWEITHMSGLSFKAFSDWLQAYGRASRQDDAAASAALFTEDAEYYESPFNTPIAGRAAIRNYWEEGAQRFTDKHTSYEILAVSGNRGIARWRAQITDRQSGQRIALDCVLIVEFNESGHCRLFREWWHSQKLHVARKPGSTIR
jgi:ketosteroid isomerase-like protein